MNERIGIAILAYYGLNDVKTAVRSVQEHTKRDYHLMVFDNSEDAEIREWALRHAPSVDYVRSGYNVGCAVARNRIAENLAQRGVRHFVIMDEDVAVVEDAWVDRMLQVFAKYPDTGICGWNLANKSMGPKHRTDKTGALRELPGMCNMYSMECIVETGGWCGEYFFYRWDTDFCLSAALAGFATRVVNPHGERDGVRHNHPHQGVNRHPNVGQIKRQSQAIFDRRKKTFGFASVGF